MTELKNDLRTLSITVDDLHCIVKALATAEVSYSKTAAAAATAISRNQAVNDRRESRQLRDRLCRYLACSDPK